MKFKELKCKIKEEQKSLARKIKRGKFLRKPTNRKDITKDEKTCFVYSDDNGTCFFKDWEVGRLSWEYRHKHIAYCSFFNNTPYERIESTDKYHRPISSKIKSYKKEWESQFEQIIHHSA
jgi:hypothetical protein